MNRFWNHKSSPSDEWRFSTEKANWIIIQTKTFHHRDNKCFLTMTCTRISHDLFVIWVLNSKDCIIRLKSMHGMLDIEKRRKIKINKGKCIWICKKEICREFVLSAAANHRAKGTHSKCRKSSECKQTVVK